MSARFEIRETPSSKYGASWGVSVYYDVWDTAVDMRVPFGRYRDREQAERRLAKEEAR